MKAKFLIYFFGILFYWFLFFTIISFGFYIFFYIMPIYDLESLMVRNYARHWLIINIILTLIAGGFYKNLTD